MLAVFLGSKAETVLEGTGFDILGLTGPNVKRVFIKNACYIDRHICLAVDEAETAIFREMNVAVTKADAGQRRLKALTRRTGKILGDTYAQSIHHACTN